MLQNLPTHSLLADIRGCSELLLLIVVKPVTRLAAVPTARAPPVCEAHSQHGRPAHYFQDSVITDVSCLPVDNNAPLRTPAPVPAAAPPLVSAFPLSGSPVSAVTRRSSPSASCHSARPSAMRRRVGRTRGFLWPRQRSVWTDPMFIRSPADGLWVVAKVWLMRMVLHERLCTGVWAPVCNSFGYRRRSRI